MNNEMNFEFELKKRFNDEAPELPEGLGKENIMKMLENDTYTPKKKKRIFAKTLAIAASFLIVLTSVYALPLLIPEKGLAEAFPAKTEFQNPPEYEVIDNGLTPVKLLRAESNKDLENHFLKIYKSEKIDNMIDDTFGMFAAKAEDAVYSIVDSSDGEIQLETQAATSQAVAPAAPSAPSSSESVDDSLKDSTSGAGESYGKTNTQVENVDEADIIKNDGKYIYILSGGTYEVERRVTILNAADMEVASRITIEGDDCSYNIQEMYVNGDRLIILASEYDLYEEENEIYYGAYVYDTAYPYSYNSGRVVSFVYDISDRENPSLIRKVSQDGSQYVSSRMIDGVLYTVSEYSVRMNSEDAVRESAVPRVNGEQVSCDCIYIYDYDSSHYVVLSAYDTKLDDGEISTLSILGGGSEVYCSQDALYVASANYDYEKGSYTDIYSFAIDKTKISYKASGTVKGDFLNQFSFDEYDGNLRVATTYYSYVHDVDVSSIYVLNKDLQLIGALEDIAYDEQVKSVRFMGSVAYLVTFRNTDPLFTVDLSDPTAPEIIGEVKLPGYSSYLHPVADGLVVGLGYDGDEENADFSSIKVSLFDVSDLKNPKEVDTFVLKNVYSQALDNPKAFITYPEENLIGFPVEHYDERTVLSYKLLKIENGEISSHLGYVHKTERVTGDVFRGTYIGQKLYTIDNYNVCEFDISNAEMLRSCAILNAEDDIPDYEEYDYYDYAVTSAAVMPGDTGAVTVVEEYTVYDEVTSAGVTVDVDYTTTLAPDYAVTYETTQSVSYTGKYSFNAKVTEVYSSGAALVEVTDSVDSNLSVGTQAEISFPQSESFEKGDIICVVFDGMVQETYPVKIPNVIHATVVSE